MTTAPCDLNGQPLAIGDTVTITCTVVGIDEDANDGDDGVPVPYRHLILEIDEWHRPRPRLHMKPQDVEKYEGETAPAGRKIIATTT